MSQSSDSDTMSRQNQPDGSSANGSQLPDSLRQFAFFILRSDEDIDTPRERGSRAWNDALADLAELAEPEPWDGSASGIQSHAILNNYIRNTYRRLVMEEKVAISSDGGHAAFNTGLLTPHAEAIFGVFTQNRHPGAQPWFFVHWGTESDRLVLQYFPDPPDMAEYVVSTADLVYDWTKPLKLAYEHILVDNLDRFPSDLAINPTRARQALDHAVEWTLKRTRRNYKVIVPQWYPKLRDAGAQFLLPLDLTATGQTDLALVVSEIGEAYRGHTILTLDMAYSNARLVARPDSDWLVPDAPSTSSEEDE